MTNPFRTKVATTTRTDKHGYKIVKYHNTDVVKFNADRIILDSGGWHTLTTKNRFNEAAQIYDLDYLVHQINHKWYVLHNDINKDFKDGIILKR
jgi:hypothetical protein